eukprot:2922105-Rhodomonas_salina.1
MACHILSTGHRVEVGREPCALYQNGTPRMSVPDMAFIAHTPTLPTAVQLHPISWYPDTLRQYRPCA